nr:zinc finger BED domain-containing protein RICESLEEPER 2-like [Tanacetum cinerariifolium]
MSDNTTKAQCKHRFHFFSQSSNSTLRSHIIHPHCEALKTVPEPIRSSIGRDGSVFVFNPDYLREQLAGLVIQRGLPFNYFDHEQTTRVFLNTMQPKYNHAKKWFNDSLEGLYNIYYAKYGNPTIESMSETSSSRVSGGNQMTTLLNRLKEHKNKKARCDSSLSSKYERYVHSDFITHLQYSEYAGFDVLDFWKEKESMFPVLTRMAMDLLTVQATLVAFESAYSTSGRVLSIRRTKLTPSSLQMCMCFKNHLDAQERQQHTSTLENALDFEDEILDAKVQENEATPLSDEEIALDAASQGTMASGSGGEEQDFDYDLTNYGIDD